MMILEATLAIESRDKIAEGPVWDAAGRRLIWVDHAGELIHAATLHDEGGWREQQRWALGHTVAAALPRARGGLVVAGANEIHLMSEGGDSTPLALLQIDPWCRLNDVKCDARGRIWAGTLTLDFSARAGLYRVDTDGAVTQMLGGLTLSNGFDWSPDGRIFYLVDSLMCTVEAFDFDVERGTIANRRAFLSIRPPVGIPNGMTVDSEGCLWVVLTTAGEVQRFAPDGTLLARVKIAVSGVTSCAFGGVDGRDLFITTRSGRVPEIVKTLEVAEDRMESTGPQAGGVFVCRPGVAGLPATPFLG